MTARNGAAMAQPEGKPQSDQVMQPLPALASFARRVVLAQHKLTLFLYDTRPDDRNSVPLLLVHGLGDEADTWRHVLPVLAAQRRVLAIDLPGFGRSDKPDASYAVPWYVAVLCDLLDTLQIERVALAGHSLGAITCHWLALEQPARVERLVLLAGGLAAAPRKPDLNTLLLLTPGIGEWLYTRLRRDPQAAYNSLRSFYANLDALPQSERDFLFQRVNERVWNDDQRRAFFCVLRGLARWLPAQQKSLPGRMNEFTISTVVLWGENDQVASVENGRLLATLQSTARLTLLPGAGHNLHQEQPREVTKILADFYARSTA
jgi:pimeloyl-ACP methyl ester carboxylesterase